MQTIKGLIVLLLVAVAVFVVVGLNDIRSQNEYAAKLLKPAAASAVTTGRQTAIKTETNAVRQVRQKIRNANL